jgi:hypothetical protein
MANDIKLIKSGQPIKHGTAVTTTTNTGTYSKLDSSVFNDPVIGDIEDKYDARFDKPRYYTGDSPNDS